MYVDLGKRRGRLHFSWKELCMLSGLAASGVGYIVRAEVKFATLRDQVQQCQRELQAIRPPAANRGGAAGDDHGAAIDDGR